MAISVQLYFIRIIEHFMAHGVLQIHFHALVSIRAEKLNIPSVILRRNVLTNFRSREKKFLLILLRLKHTNLSAHLNYFNMTWNGYLVLIIGHDLLICKNGTQSLELPYSVTGFHFCCQTGETGTTVCRISRPS